jgi:hypothetical protein
MMLRIARAGRSGHTSYAAANIAQNIRLNSRSAAYGSQCQLIWRAIFQTGTEAKLTIGRPEQVNCVRSTETRTHEIRER